MKPQEIDELAEQLADASWRIRKRACGTAVALIEAGPGGLQPLRRRLLDAIAQGENVGLRNAALEVLGRVGERALEALVAAYDEASPGARKFF
ncbi:MAG: hypothetical protein GXP55_25455, partial [Deltaproteobacteria bacterium]|nr:hypothetical protein [Deltaproteobacteria bacterium]